MKKKSFLYGTVILILVNFVVRVLGFIYKIILSRMIGPEGIGLFHLVYPVLMILITFTSAGIPVAVSKLVAYNQSLNNKRGCNKILGLSLLLGILISSMLSLLLLYKAKYIAYNVIKNENIYYSLIALIPAIPLITLSSIFRGYYYGIKDVGPPGVSQIIEQVIRVVFVVGTLKLLLPIDPKLSAFIAVIGISVGELSGLIWLLIKFKIIEAIQLRRTYNIIREGSKNILSSIVFISVPITITRFIGVVIQSINAVLVPQRLQLAGYTSQEALVIFGKLAGMALPILFLPFIVTSALVVNIIPTVSEEMAVKNWSDIRIKAGIAIRMTILVAIPAMTLFIFFSNPLCEFMYNQRDVGQYLSLLSYSMVFLSLHHTASGILHGMGKQVLTTINYLIGMTIQLLCTYFLVPNPLFGVNGYIIGFILSSITICLLNLFWLNYYVKLEISFFNSVAKPTLAAAAMIILILFVYERLMSMGIIMALAISISLLAGFLIFLSILILSGGLNFKTIAYIFKK